MRSASPEQVWVTEPDLDVLAAVARLSVQQRAAVILTYWEDLTQNEVAARLGISIGLGESPSGTSASPPQGGISMRDPHDAKLRELAYRLAQMAPDALPLPEESMVHLRPSPTSRSSASPGPPYAVGARRCRRCRRVGGGGIAHAHRSPHPRPAAGGRHVAAGDDRGCLGDDIVYADDRAGAHDRRADIAGAYTIG